MDPGWKFDKADENVAEELRGFLPKRIFDAHAHIWRVVDVGGKFGFFSQGPDVATAETWRTSLGKFFPDADIVGAILMAIHKAGSADPLRRLDAANDFLVEQLEKAPNCRGHLFISPDYPISRVTEYLENPQVVGFKPYHSWSKQKPTWQAPLISFLPEWVWELAHERGLTITLHMVKDRAVADPENQREIREMCTKYPRARLILAHAARCFHAPNARGLPALRGLTNVWFDTSGICEAAPIIAILKEFGTKQIMWGSDFPVCEIRGRSVTIGDGFAWVQWDTLDWDNSQVKAHPILVGLESLRATREAADQFGLSAQDIEDLFCNNALRLLGMSEDAGTATHDLYAHAKQRIPGGTQLFSKRPERLAPGQWPAYFSEARGCETWDLDGRHYYDMSTNSVGACLLGYRDPDVTRSVQRRLNLGIISSLNPPEEVDLADRLCEIHPWAQQARFVRGGGEAVTVAVRIARAATDRSMVAVCGYHGWHDWYLAANLGESDALRGHALPGLLPLGAPVELRGTVATFTYNNREEFRAIIDKHGDHLAAVVMEPCRRCDPDPGFLEYVRDEAHRHGALLVFDEVSIGWRTCYGGAHLRFGVHPDLAAFAKALGNGHPIGAVIGTREAMEAAQRSFISSTYWTEGAGPAAAVATLDKMARIDVPAHVARIGTKVQMHWRELGQEHGLPVEVMEGYPCLAHFAFKHEKAPELSTLYTQWMLDRGFLAGCGLYATLAHTDEIVALYAESIDEVFGRIAETLARGEVEKALRGPAAQSDFRRLV